MLSDEALRLLERLTTDEAMHYLVDHGNPGYPGDKGVQVGNELHCNYCDANVDSVDSDDRSHKADCPWAEARAFLAQPEGAREAALVALVDKVASYSHDPDLMWFLNEHPTRSNRFLAAELVRLECALADTSPAAAVLLAQAKVGREHVAWGEDSQRTLNRMCEAYRESKQEVRALLAAKAALEACRYTRHCGGCENARAALEVALIVREPIT